MAAEGGLFCLVRSPRSYQRRPILADIADCEVVERFRLSRVNELGDKLRIPEKHSEKLPAARAPEIQINTSVAIIVVVVVVAFR